jgi:multidrug efflux pump subunit AcrB
VNDFNFATWGIRQPIPPLVGFLLLCVFGVFGFRQLGIQDLPDMEFPAVTVTAVLQGASPSQLETEVTRKIENAVASVGDIEHIMSTVTDGVSNTTVQFILEKDIFEALNDVRAAVSNIRSDLPPDLEEPVVNKINTAGAPILTFSVASERMDEEGLSWFVDNTVARSLLAIPGVGRVTRLGGVDREVRVELDPAKLAALDLAVTDVSRQLKRVQLQASGGRAEIGDARQSLRTLATVARASELAAVDIALSGGRHVRLDQIATIYDTTAERTQLALLDGRPVVCFQVSRARGSSALAVADDVEKAVLELGALHRNVKFDVVHESVRIIRDEYQASINMLIEGALLAILVVWIFLRDWRATIVSASALPLSIIPTFAAMHWMGFTLNTVTLLAMSLVIGLLVDDAIVEIENIVRHLRSGKSPMRASMDAATEIGLAVVATSMTLVAVFLPTAFMGGIPGLVFKQFGWTAVFAVLTSLAVARLLTPMLASRLLKRHDEKKDSGRLLEWYLRIADAALRHRFTTLVAATAFFVGSLLMIPLLPQDFVPTSDRAQTQLSIELSPGTTLAETRRTVEHVLAILDDVPEVATVFAAIGTSGGFSMGPSMGRPGGTGDVRKANLSIRLTPRNERERSQTLVENDIRGRLKSVPGARFTLGFGGTGEKIQLAIAGDDEMVLHEAARAVETELRALPGLGNVTSSSSLLRPEIMIEPDYARAAELGVTASAIGETVQVATAGDYDAALPKLNLPERQVDIRVQLPLETRRDLEALRELRVPGNHGLVPLSSVATVRVGSGPAQIDRMDRSRNIRIDAELGGWPLGEATKAVDALPAVRNLPQSVRMLDTGDAERMKELFGSFGLAMFTGVMCVYFVLVLLFKDFMQPITILAALPLSLGGAFMALLLGGKSMSMPAMIGLLLLMGLTTKNSILLVEYASVSIKSRGMDMHEALMDACRKRARPIVMTTLAMAAGMMPVALGLDADMSFRSPMAVAVIGGLITSTVLSLVVIPVVFTYVAHAETWLKRMLRLESRVHAPPSPESHTVVR